MDSTAPYISKETFLKILRDESILQEDDLLIFQTINSLYLQEASATDLARIIGWKHKNDVVNKIVALGKRILKKYPIEQREREDGTKSYWDFFFDGYFEGNFFIYQLKPELTDALEESGLVSNINPIPTHNTYLFSWNPSKWDWIDIEEDIEELQITGKVTKKWKCKSHKSIRIGDRAFLVKLGSTQRGIIGSGKVISEPFFSEDSEEDIALVLIEFDILLNHEKEPILELENLNSETLSKQAWTPQASGSVQSQVVNELEKIWFEFLTTQNIRVNPFRSTDASKDFFEGTPTQVLQTRYERNIHARNECLKHYGYSCAVCEFNFEHYYGNIGYQFIHVHHLNQISSIGKEYKVNPIEDLRPVCPNCHTMLHKENPPLTIDELRNMITQDF